MSACSLQAASVDADHNDPQGGLVYELAGDLDFESVPVMLPQLRQLLVETRSTPLVLDLAGVDSANSAAVALLIECRALAKTAGTEVEFRHLPDSIVKIAGVCEVGNFLN